MYFKIIVEKVEKTLTHTLKDRIVPSDPPRKVGIKGTHLDGGRLLHDKIEFIGPPVVRATLVQVDMEPHLTAINQDGGPCKS